MLSIAKDTADLMPLTTAPITSKIPPAILPKKRRASPKPFKISGITKSLMIVPKVVRASRLRSMASWTGLRAASLNWINLGITVLIKKFSRFCKVGNKAAPTDSLVSSKATLRRSICPSKVLA